MNSIEQNVKAARSPQEALLALARGIDAVLESLHERTEQPDPWGEWDDQAVHEKANDEFAGSVKLDAQLRAIIAGTDWSDPEAAAAARRLLTNPGEILEHGPAAGDEAKATVTDDEIIVEAPTPTDEDMAERREFAEKVLKLHENFKQLGPEALDAYAKAGPLWLYLGSKDGRDFILGLPPELRRVMVTDVARFSPREALNMGRDVLKDTSPGDQTVTMENLISIRKHEGKD